MKILHCLNHFLPHHIAGTEVYTLSLINALLPHNIEAAVVIPNYGKSVSEEYKVHGIRVFQYAEPSKVDKALLMGRRAPDGLSAFEEIMVKENPDVIHFHELAGSNGITLHHVRTAKALGFKIVMTFHVAKYSCKTGTLMYKNSELCDGVIDKKRCTECWFEDRNTNYLQSKVLTVASSFFDVLRWDTTKWNNSIGTALGFPFIIQECKENLHELIRNCDASVVLTKWYKTVLERNDINSSKINLITQALPENTALKTNHLIDKKSKIKLVFIGRINHFKGVLLLIKALQDVNPEKVTLDIYGQQNDDAYTMECKKVSASMENIHWMGILPPGNVVSTLVNYDVMCLPSTVCEMSPLVIQEAFAAGIPVLASNGYGNAEQITNDKNGWLFEFKNQEDLKIKVECLVNNPEKIKAAKENILPVKTFQAVAEEYKILYDKILAPG